MSEEKKEKKDKESAIDQMAKFIEGGAECREDFFAASFPDCEEPGYLSIYAYSGCIAILATNDFDSCVVNISRGSARMLVKALNIMIEEAERQERLYADKQKES